MTSKNTNPAGNPKVSGVTLLHGNAGQKSDKPGEFKQFDALMGKLVNVSKDEADVKPKS